MPQVFISYARVDEPFARQLAAALSESGADVWLDVEDIPAGMNWSSAIQQGLDASELMIVVISPESMASRNVENEWQFFIDEGKPVVPVLWRKTRVHFQLNRLQYINFEGQPFDQAWKQLHAELRRKGLQLNPLPGVGDTSGQIPLQPALPVLDATAQPALPVLEVTARAARPKPANIVSRRLWMGAGLLALVAVVGIGLSLLNRGTTPPSPTPTTAATLSDPSTQVWLDFTRTAESYTATPTRTPTAMATPPATANVTQTYEAAQQIAGLTLTAQLPGFTPVTRNADWAPVTQDFDGVTMVLVPVGCFDMGDDPESYNGENQGVPAGERQCFEQPFWLDLTEVTQADFERLGGQKANPNAFDGEQRPVESITWFEARDFCALRGMRLPTEREWEYAARGPDNRIYPWGNDWNPESAVWSGNSEGQTATVGSRPAGVSWVGALDMSGNVSEWVSSLYQDYPYVPDDGREADTDNSTNVRRVLRGGSWNYALTSPLRAPARVWGTPNFQDGDVGFRCARSS